jgi:hypothetical protein
MSATLRNDRVVVHHRAAHSCSSTLSSRQKMKSEERDHFTEVGSNFMGEVAFPAIPRSDENA